MSICVCLCVHVHVCVRSVLSVYTLSSANMCCSVFSPNSDAAHIGRFARSRQEPR